MAASKDMLLGRLQGGMDLSRGDRIRLTFMLAVPAILAQLSMCLMSYIDAAMVGRLGSAEAAAVGLVSTTTWIFGSFSRGEETAESDVDILVQFLPGVKMGLAFCGMICDLEDALHRPVDLVREGCLKPFAQESVEHDKILIYNRSDKAQELSCQGRRVHRRDVIGGYQL